MFCFVFLNSHNSKERTHLTPIRGAGQPSMHKERNFECRVASSFQNVAERESILAKRLRYAGSLGKAVSTAGMSAAGSELEPRSRVTHLPLLAPTPCLSASCQVWVGFLCWSAHWEKGCWSCQSEGSVSQIDSSLQRSQVAFWLIVSLEELGNGT